MMRAFAKKCFALALLLVPASMVCAQVDIPLVWQGINKVSVNTTLLKVTRSSPNPAWDAYCHSVNQLPASTEGTISFKLVNSNGNMAIGLNNTPASGNYSMMDYCFSFQGGQVLIFENGMLVGNFGSVNSTAVYSIERTETEIKYYEDEMRLHSSTHSAFGTALIADISIFTQNSGFENLYCSFGGYQFSILTLGEAGVSYTLTGASINQTHSAGATRTYMPAAPALGYFTTITMNVLNNSADAGLDVLFEIDRQSNIYNVRLYYTGSSGTDVFDMRDDMTSVTTRFLEFRDQLLTDGVLQTINTLDDDCATERQNYHLVKNFNEFGTAYGIAKEFYDGLGRPVQVQSGDDDYNDIRVSETIYDAAGRPAVHTLNAPSYGYNFCYKPYFTVSETGQEYYHKDFDSDLGTATDDNPMEVSATISSTSKGKLHWYWHNQNNTEETQVDYDGYPLAITDYYDDPLNRPRKQGGVGTTFQPGTGHESTVFYLPHGGELAYMYGAAGSHVSNLEGPVRAMKTVTRAADGLEYVEYSDEHSRTIATCISGLTEPECGQTTIHYINTEDENINYVDVHVPASAKNGAGNASDLKVSFYMGSGWDLNNSAHNFNASYTIYDLELQKMLTGSDYSINMTTGAVTFNGSYGTGSSFLRIYFQWPQAYKTEVMYTGYGGALDPSLNLPPQRITCTLDYDQWALYYYDEFGSLRKTVTPEGVDCSTYDPTIEFTEVLYQEFKTMCTDCNTDPAPVSGTYLTGNPVLTFTGMSAPGSANVGRAINLNIRGHGNTIPMDEKYCDARLRDMLPESSSAGHTVIAGNTTMAPFTLPRDIKPEGRIVDRTLGNIGDACRLDNDYSMANNGPGSIGVPPPAPIPSCPCDDCIDYGWYTQYINDVNVLLKRAKSSCYGTQELDKVELIYIGTDPFYFCVTCREKPSQPDNFVFFARFELKFRFYRTQTGQSDVEIFPDGGGPQVLYMDTEIDPAWCLVQWHWDDLSLREFNGYFSPASFPDWQAGYGFKVVLDDVNVARSNPYTFSNFQAGRVKDELLRFVNLNSTITYSTFSQVSTPPHTMVNKYDHDDWNRLAESEELDHYLTRFAYNDKGQLRFSQSHAQYQDNDKYNYFVYDDAGRLKETGVFNPVSFGKYFQNNNGEPAQTNGSTTITTATNSVFANDLINEQDGLPGTNRSEVIKLYYDVAETSPPYPNPSSWPQKFLTGRVAKTEGSAQTTWYSYDKYGRVAWMIVYLPDLPANKYKTVEYSYDMPGNVNKISFQRGVAGEEYYWNLAYDDNYRLFQVYAGTTDVTTSSTLQATYYYYQHGALERIELGDECQGLDFVYNIQGLLKAMNPHDNSAQDPGKDGFSGPHSNFAEDVFGFNLDYFDDDYNRTGGAASTFTDVEAGAEQFMGSVRNLRWWHRASLTAGGSDYENVYGYQYDQLHRLSGARWGDMAGMTQNLQGQWTYFRSDYGLSNITYDKNGNILTLKRDAYGANRAMDNFTYAYDGQIVAGSPPTLGTTKLWNRLVHFNDAVTAGNWAVDLDNPGPLNTSTSNQYMAYDGSGRPTRIGLGTAARYLQYDRSGHMTAYKDNNQFALLDLKYNEDGMRVFKKAYVPGSSGTQVDYKEHYVYGLGGQLLAIYRDEGAGLSLAQHPILGFGMYNRPANETLYELTDHLGNVRSVINRAKAGNGDAQIASYQDYYPFGAIMPGKSFYAGDKYRYDFQGQQKDEETGFNSFMLRDHSAWLGRWLTPDPMREYWSNYVSMGNDPASKIDPTGGCTDCPPDYVLEECPSCEWTYHPEDGKWSALGKDGVGGLIVYEKDNHSLDGFTYSGGMGAWPEGMHGDGRSDPNMFRDYPNVVWSPTMEELGAAGRENLAKFEGEYLPGIRNPFVPPSPHNYDLTTEIGRKAFEKDGGAWSINTEAYTEFANIISNGIILFWSFAPITEMIGITRMAAWLFGGVRVATAVEKANAFFQGAKYSQKVLKQIENADDIYHAFPKGVDAYAAKHGQWSTKVGADGKTYEWLRLEGSYGGKTGTFEYTKDANGVINHRYFNAY